MTSLISVVMGVYNAGDILSTTVESILSQEGADFEFIIVNDGSTDTTAEILRTYAKRDSRIRVVEQEHAGLTRALILGCAAAKGDYIARQDAGDISLPDRLKLQKAALETYTDISFVSCITDFCGPQGEHLFLSDGNDLAAVPTWIISDRHEKGVIDGPSHHGSVMFRKSAYEQVGGYRHQFYVAQDWDLWYRLAEIGKFQKLRQPLYRARLSPGSISALQKGKQDRIVTEAARIRPDIASSFTKKRDAAWLYFIGECLRRNGDSRAYFYLRKSIMENPLSLKPWVRALQMLPPLMIKRLAGRS
jgi:glycosyltransferase involved in cell wall biosynthesis